MRTQPITLTLRQAYSRSEAWLRRPSAKRTAVRAIDQDQGFTLVELLVVMAILAMLAAFAGPAALRQISGARVKSAQVQISALASALELYALDNGAYPPEEIGLRALVEAPGGAPRWNGPYLQKSTGLMDPWGRPYRYKLKAPGGQVTIFSLGRDNAVGGTGEDQDISN
jgi:general secretion pathway protein G